MKEQNLKSVQDKATQRQDKLVEARINRMEFEKKQEDQKLAKVCESMFQLKQRQKKSEEIQ